jgi:hypothetical protein
LNQISKLLMFSVYLLLTVKLSDSSVALFFRPMNTSTRLLVLANKAASWTSKTEWQSGKVKGGWERACLVDTQGGQPRRQHAPASFHFHSSPTDSLPLDSTLYHSLPTAAAMLQHMNIIKNKRVTPCCSSWTNKPALKRFLQCTLLAVCLTLNITLHVAIIIQADW